MPFRYESEMAPPVEAWLRSVGLDVRREFPAPWGVCDLVAASLAPRRAAARLALGQRKTLGAPFRVGLLLRIPDRRTRKSITSDELRREYGKLADHARITAALERLVAEKFVVRTAHGAYQRVNSWMPLHRRLVAVELKLSKVAEALQQAVRNQEFASESYIGLPAPLARRIARGAKRAAFDGARRRDTRR